MRLLPLLAALIALPATAHAAPADHAGDGEPAFRALFKELIETNTEHSVGSCTQAATQIEARLKAAGYSDADIHMFAPDSAPKDGGIVATLPGSDPKAKAVLLMAHLDVVEAKREDWTRDPFTLYEENGQFYGRGVADDKGEAAIFADLMIRYKSEGYRPKHTIKLALTCGEETEGVFNGAQWLSTTHKDWIDAGLALNEGIFGQLDKNGKRFTFDMEAAEKVYQDFTIETTNPGGHSSLPRPDNAIYAMAGALRKVETYSFPVELNDATRGYFTGMSKIVGGEDGAAMTAIVANPNDAAADARLSKNTRWHALLRTTCVATMISGGHAVNALPQSVKANINCRMMPGTKAESVLATLTQVIDDPNVKVSLHGDVSPGTSAPPLGPDVLGPITRAAAAVYPGTPVIPSMETGASDQIYTTAAGIPTYGIYGFFEGEDEGNIHGLNEHVGVQSLLDGRRFFYTLVKLYTE
jgi:acetylornithine deacetylase/succinyl-diaminopimelate desuccinylase-like protein